MREHGIREGNPAIQLHSGAFGRPGREVNPSGRRHLPSWGEGLVGDLEMG